MDSQAYGSCPGIPRYFANPTDTRTAAWWHDCHNRPDGAVLVVLDLHAQVESGSYPSLGALHQRYESTVHELCKGTILGCWAAHKTNSTSMQSRILN